MRIFEKREIRERAANIDTNAITHFAPHLASAGQFLSAETGQPLLAGTDHHYDL